MIGRHADLLFEMATDQRQDLQIFWLSGRASLPHQEVHEINAQTMKDMGKVMAALKERYAGKLDFGKASAAVKKMLSGG